MGVARGWHLHIPGHLALRLCLLLTHSQQVGPGSARLPARRGPLSPLPCPASARLAWVTKGHPPWTQLGARLE